jgi:hypothetical protein
LPQNGKSGLLPHSEPFSQKAKILAMSIYLCKFSIWVFWSVVTGHVFYFSVVGDTGNIGGQLSHEYHLTADVGEDNLVICKR